MIGNVIAGMFAGGAAAGDFESIATVTVGAGGSSFIEFTGIASTYQHLQLRYMVRTSEVATTSSLAMQLNGASSTYTYHYFSGNGSSVNSGASTSPSELYIGEMAGSSAGSNTFGVGIIDFLDYASTNKHKTMRVLSGIDNNGSGDIRVLSNLYFPSTIAAISSIKIRNFGGGQTLSQYSHFALYGIKG